MTNDTGIDPLRGRPTPAVASTEERVQRRKLDSLKRGIHRVDDRTGLAYRIHLIGIGGAGVAVVASALAEITPAMLAAPGAGLCVLAVDIGDGAALEAVREQARRLADTNCRIDVLPLAMPAAADLHESLCRYPAFLRLEYPLYEGAAAYAPWIDAEMPMPRAGEPVPRALAKAIYGAAYYDGERPADAALRRFATGVAATPGESIVCVCFGLGGGTGSGIAVDLARHLSNVRFGRRVLTVGMGIAPCDGDDEAHRGAHLFPVLSELECMGDEAKNQGAVQACGDLYRNPFTAGFLLVPQQQIWEGTRTLAATHRRVDQEVAALITCRNGANLWETLRLLNWVAAPSTQHSAARTPYGTRWIHMVGFADADADDVTDAHLTEAGPTSSARADIDAASDIAARVGTVCIVDADLPRRLGLLPGYRPEFIEARVAAPQPTRDAQVRSGLDVAFSPVIPPEVTGGGRAGAIQFLLPQLATGDLRLFADARDAYDRQTPQDKLLGHSWLLERGVVLCEPSSTLDGMAGASLTGASNWIAVPYAALRGEARGAPAVV